MRARSIVEGSLVNASRDELSPFGNQTSDLLHYIHVMSHFVILFMCSFDITIQCMQHSMNTLCEMKPSWSHINICDVLGSELSLQGDTICTGLDWVFLLICFCLSSRCCHATAVIPLFGCNNGIQV